MEINIIDTALETIDSEVANFFDSNRNASITIDSRNLRCDTLGWMAHYYKCQPKQINADQSAQCMDKKSQSLDDYFTSLPDSNCANTVETA